MGDFLGLLVRIVADIYLLILALHLVLEPRSFYLSPVLSPLRQASEPLLIPLRRWLGGPVRAVAVAILAVLVARGLLLGVLSPGQLVFSPASQAIGHVFGAAPLVAALLMSLLYGFDWTFVVLLISLVLSLLLEPYTVNPITRFAFRMADLGERAIGPLGSVLPSDWQRRTLTGILAIVADAVLAAGMLAVVVAAGHDAPHASAVLVIGLYSALTLTVAYGLGFFIVVIVVGALMSWFSPDPMNPLVRFITAVCFPLVAPFRRYIPPIAGIDISPIFAILLLGAAQSVLTQLVNRLLLG
jgi:YggT family protein